MKNTILYNWHFMRWFRLIVAIIIMVQAAVAKDFILAAFGAFFAITAIFNVACCGTSSCQTRQNITPKNKNDIWYEEVV